jgi:hypothetical protein
LFDSFHRKIEEKLKALKGKREREDYTYTRIEKRFQGSVAAKAVHYLRRKIMVEKEEEKGEPVPLEAVKNDPENPEKSSTNDLGIPSEQEKDYQSIHDATQLLNEVKDIRDELNILNYLLTQQKGVWEKLLGLLINEDGSVMWNEALLRETEKWKGPGYALKDVMEMEKIAHRIQESVHLSVLY